jgi:enhancing lycopene biosynthesis protein 2
MKKFAVVLSGCGVYDGAEIQEAVLTLLAIQQNGAAFEIFAPDKDQHHVVNHTTGAEMPETRNVLIESARIARGNIRSLDQFNAAEFDALVFPGGFGVAKNLCTWAFDGPAFTVDPLVAKVLQSALDHGLAIGAMCIAPVLLTKLPGGVAITIGADPNDAKMVEETGSTHIATGHGDVVKDPDHPIFTAPCYMLDASVVDIYTGTGNLIKAILASL